MVENIAHCSTSDQQKKPFSICLDRIMERPTFMEPIHVELSYEGRDIGMLKILPASYAPRVREQARLQHGEGGKVDERTPRPWRIHEKAA
jgi:hypothetical protein